jgi:hypothetical protein
MATSYVIGIGYNSGYSSNKKSDDLWEKIRDISLELCNNPELIVEEALKVDSGKVTLEELTQYSKCYITRTDSTIRFNEDEKQIRQCASGSLPSRLIKEILRRAFCRLLLYKAHAEGIEITIGVY